MKYIKILITTIVLLLVVPSFLLAQTIDRLDKINGFKKFKLGSHLNSYSDLQPKTQFVKFNGVKDYVYSGKDIKELYGVQIEEITLSFYKNRLYKIMVSFGSIFREYRYDQFDLIRTNLEANFGRYFHQMAPSAQAEILNGMIWDARDVRLETIRLNLAERDGSRSPKFNYIQGFVLFIHKGIQQEQMNSELD